MAIIIYGFRGIHEVGIPDNKQSWKKKCCSRNLRKTNIYKCNLNLYLNA